MLPSNEGSWFFPWLRNGGGLGWWKKEVEVEGGVFGSIREAEGDLRIAETGGGCISADATGASA